MFKKYQDSLLLIARLVIGGIFIYAGWVKIAHMADNIAMFASMGIPAWLTYIVAYAEFIGGILVVLGIFTELAAFALAVIMLVAAYLSREMGPAGYMLPVAVFAALLQFFSGPGHYSIGCLFFGRNK
jgi:putative oxidoreductase